jgi:two-component system, sporulation sensor kinase A
VLDEMLVKLIHIAIAESGAERGYLLVERDCQLEITAIIAVQTIAIVPAIALGSDANIELFSLEVINYVAATQANIIIDRTIQNDLFSQDSYILDRQPTSILCTPLIEQGKRVGILYLENFITSTFTNQQLEILQFLFTQVAISLDNIQSQPLELDVGERTNELTQTNDRLQAEILERQKSEQILRSIVEGTVSATGVDFFRSLVRSLAQALGVRYAFISECLDAPPTRVRSFAFWQGNEFGNEFEYDLYGTPCERIIGSNSYQCFPAQIQSLFPEEKDDLEAMQAQSYAGTPLLTSTGELLGHLAVLDDKQMESDNRTQAIIEIFAARAAAEMERLQIEAELRASETKFATAFQLCPEAIVITRLKDGRCVEVNERCLQTLGYAREELIGSIFSELGIYENPAIRVENVRQLQAQGKVSNREIWCRRRSGEVFLASYSSELIYLADEPFVLTLGSDITLLKQAEKALARLAEIGELAATIVHEVRNPLTTIMMCLNAFKKLQLDARFQEYLTLSSDEAERLERLLNQILFYSRPQILDRAEIALESFIAETLNTLQTTPVAAGKSLNLVAMRSPINISVDRDKLKQVLINLITNACEAVNSGDAITIEIHQPEDGDLQQRQSQRVCIQIHNSGTPIPIDILSEITKPFFTTKASGTGLGLAIVKRIVEAHNGEFRIESSAEMGTIVKVHLPLFLF